MQTLAAAVAHRPLVLDGGLGTQLEAHGHDLSSHLWSARLLLEDPEAVVAAHRDFLAAGAEVLITSSYQVSYDGLAAVGVGPEEVDVLLRRSVELARRAVAEHAGASGDERPRWVAASVGPWGAARGDGSEYRGDTALSVRQLRAWHRRRLQVLAAAGADVLALETVPGAAEAEALLAELADLEGASSSGPAAWLSLTCAGGRTRAGEAAADAFALARGVPGVLAVGVNCCEPQDAAALVPVAVAACDLPAVVYPNSGEVWDARARRWRGAAAPVADGVDTWVAHDARLVGGCCRVGPDQVAGIAARVAPA
ncbi:homocysteine S-methyltransferase [Quadrisphaera sp. DSM 44207]|uniref:homocysteine S-methyltransferase n=1 Tax=Quadrisphaera sp. DSM 44207 TaxID=1881057 RepID=UPI000882D58E|nr:homocysteine S-methyltransferase [Quadrisphaera sp. DSM 44207]SDQ47382.1 homocysteine S-methyltransferase [Quadrisphaera sp. DSM 44207]